MEHNTKNKESTKRVLDRSLLLPRDRYQEVMKVRGKLPHFEIENDNKILFYFGANHSRDPHNEQYPKLREYWNDFINKTKDLPRIVLIEGNLRKVEAIEEDAIRNGSEGSLVTIWATNSKIPLACPDPLNGEVGEELLKQFPKDYIAYYYFISNVNGWNRFPDPKPEFSSYVSGYFMREKERTSWTDFDFSLEHMKKIHRELFNEEFNENTFFNTDNPNRTDSVINEVARASSDIRDFRIASEIIRYWNEGKSIFTVFGNGHLILEEDAIRAALE